MIDRTKIEWVVSHRVLDCLWLDVWETENREQIVTRRYIEQRAVLHTPIGDFSLQGDLDPAMFAPPITMDVLRAALLRTRRYAGQKQSTKKEVFFTSDVEPFVFRGVHTRSDALAAQWEKQLRAEVKERAQAAAQITRSGTRYRRVRGKMRDLIEQAAHGVCARWWEMRTFEIAMEELSALQAPSAAQILTWAGRYTPFPAVPFCHAHPVVRIERVEGDQNAVLVHTLDISGHSNTYRIAALEFGQRVRFEDWHALGYATPPAPTNPARNAFLEYRKKARIGAAKELKALPRGKKPTAEQEKKGHIGKFTPKPKL